MLTRERLDHCETWELDHCPRSLKRKCLGVCDRLAHLGFACEADGNASPGPVYQALKGSPTGAGSRNGFVGERRTRNQKVASSSPGRSGGRIFFSRVNILCWLLFGVRSTPVLLHLHVEDPGHSAKSAGGGLHL